jgi:hypothetical protein
MAAGTESSTPAIASAVAVFGFIITSSGMRACRVVVGVHRTASTHGPIPLVALDRARRMARGRYSTVADGSG